MSCTIDMCINGMPVRKINYAGRTYLPVEHGKEFTIRITNHNNYRVCVVVSVDGLSVMDGKPANHDGAGYVIGAHQTTIIKGWRRGDTEVAAFEVSTKGGSYAAKTGHGGNVGVIGVAVYPEKRVARMEPLSFNDAWKGGEKRPRRFTSRSCSCSKGIGGQSAGTGYGGYKADHVTRVEFERNVSGKRVIILNYDTVDGLRDKGVPVDAVVGSPNPFPAQPDNLYCPPPPGN